MNNSHTEKYNRELLSCSCGKKPKLEKNNYGYYKYECKKDNLRTFFSKTPITAKELWNSAISNISKLKVRI